MTWVALGGSRRVPKKNIKMLGDHPPKPLIAFTIEEAKKAHSLDYFLVSTNDEEIAKISKAWGAHVPFKRPEPISEDIDSVFCLKHALEWYERKKQQKVSHVCCLQPTSPLKNSDDIDRCIQIAKETDADTVISISSVKQHPFWMFSLQPNQQLTPYMDIDLEGDNLVWQKLPILFYPNGAIYVTKRDLILQNRIFGDQIYGYMMPTERSIDLEEEFDFIVCSALLPMIKKNNKEWVKLSWRIS